MELHKKYDEWQNEPGEERKSVSINEYVVWKNFKQGDLEAYAFIYRKYFFVLFSYGKKLCSDHELVRDCIQELFVKIWNNRENLTETNSIKYYLFTSLKRKLLDALKTPHIRFAADQDLLDEDIINQIQNVEEADEDLMASQKEKVLKALNQLSQHQQILLNMKFYKNLSNKEIAGELGITIQSVYNAVFKALRSLRNQLSISVLIILSVLMY